MTGKKMDTGIFSLHIQYLDHKVLTQILLDTEPELFRKQEEKNPAATPT